LNLFARLPVPTRPTCPLTGPAPWWPFKSPPLPSCLSTISLPSSQMTPPLVHCEKWTASTTLFSHLDLRFCRSIYPMALPPLPPANPDEHQHWTDPIFCEETRAKLEHFRNLGWLPPNYKPKTFEGIAVVERYWRRYTIPPFA
jgi:hypothetical protein